MWKLRWEEFSECRLIVKAAEGDREAGEQLVCKHYASVFGFMMSLTQNRDASEELVQSTFVAAWQSLSGFQHKSSLRTWLHRIAFRQYAAWREKQTREVSIEPSEPSGLESGLVDGMWIRQAIAAMPGHLAEPFVLHYVQQIPVNEVAEILDLKRGTVLSRLHSARQLMRKLMTGNEPSATETAEIPSLSLDTERSPYEMSKTPV
jgi:RNA polymerase sigma-70 factor, ECF subfamily